MRRRGIRTFYAGTWYRSRLEARWACFFDIVGISRDYEPLDTDDAYIPDFVLGGRILAEVRPIIWENLRDDAPLVEAREQLERVAADFTALAVLGATVRHVRNGVYSLGDVATRDASGRWAWTELTAAWALSWKARPGEHTLRIADAIEGRAPLRFLRLGHDVERLWNEAGNRVQWIADGGQRHVSRPIRRVFDRLEQRLIAAHEDVEE